MAIQEKPYRVRVMGDFHIEGILVRNPYEEPKTDDYIPIDKYVLFHIPSGGFLLYQMLVLALAGYQKISVTTANGWNLGDMKSGHVGMPQNLVELERQDEGRPCGNQTKAPKEKATLNGSKASTAENGEEIGLGRWRIKKRLGWSGIVQPGEETWSVPETQPDLLVVYERPREDKRNNVEQFAKVQSSELVVCQFRHPKHDTSLLAKLSVAARTQPIRSVIGVLHVNSLRDSRYDPKPKISATSIEQAAADIKEAEIFPKAVDGCANSSGLSFAVDEHDAVDQVF